MTETTLFRSRRFVVTHEYVRSERDIYTLADVQHVKLRRPWLAFAVPIAAGIGALTMVFASELFAQEIGLSLGACAVGLLVSAKIGCLKLESIVLRDDQGRIWGPYRELAALKRAIEAAITTRQRAPARMSPATAVAYQPPITPGDSE